MSPTEPRVVKVTIYGRDYAFASQGAEADERVREAAKVVDGERSWLRRRFRLEMREPALADVGVNLLAAAEARSLWARFGL